MKSKRILASIAASALLLTGMAGITSNAKSYDSQGHINVTATQTALYNTSGQSRYASVIHNVYSRSTGRRYTYASNSGNIISNGSPLVAGAATYNNSNVYYYVGSGTLYNGTSGYTGAYRTYNKTVR